MRNASLCPSSYRPGDEDLPGSPYYQEPPAFDLGKQGLADAAYFLAAAISKAESGMRVSAILEAQEALTALQDAITTLEEA